MAKKRTVLQGKRRPTIAGARKRIQTLLPASFRSHLKASIRECLLAFEGLFSEAVKVLEKESGKGARAKGRRIKVK